jgi:outer membrane beta-barrel protein
VTRCAGRGAVFLVAVLLSTGAGAPAAAQLGRKSWEFHPHIGAFAPADHEGLTAFEELDPGVLWGLYATYHYTDHVGVELGFSKATANGPEQREELPFGVADVGFDFWEVNAFVNSGALATVQLFATAGGGLVNYDPEDGEGPTRLLLDGGVGVRWYKWKNIALRGEVRDFVFVDARQADYLGSPIARPCPGEGSCIERTLGPRDTLHNVGVFAGLSFNF